ncbi:uncharacterized protein E0L32_002675 [Thyridium curvatum]|uniref:Uncharacterized protein n=1 Tax=Thyridium curvatum TaxID=1093900 RepID=A0A507BFN5_9PEZI|nr:uncharacterized protein E0L32_002675 [Thyridium curvatum]TPX18166.1 hypothetical protein E0L32_002675 [Thyridium curvatum]
MPRLPPPAKLPLAVRKNIRDDWESKKDDLEKQLSEVLGTAWTVDIDPAAIWPYHGDGWAKESVGSCLAAYVEGAIFQLKYFKQYQGDAGVAEVNGICSAHVLQMDLDEHEKYSYCGAEVRDRKLVILFREGCLGTNVDQALEPSASLSRALNEAEPAEGSTTKMSYLARQGVREEYDPKIDEVRAKIAKLLQREDIKLDPGFEAVCARLEAESKRPGTDLRDDWQRSLGNIAHSYFDGAAYTLEYLKFGEDDMMREALNEELAKGVVALRVVDELQNGSYCDCVVEDGTLYLQAKPTTWGVNTGQACEKLADLL